MALWRCKIETSLCCQPVPSLKTCHQLLLAPRSQSTLFRPHAKSLHSESWVMCFTFDEETMYLMFNCRIAAPKTLINLKVIIEKLLFALKLFLLKLRIGSLEFSAMFSFSSRKYISELPFLFPCTSELDQTC